MSRHFTVLKNRGHFAGQKFTTDCEVRQRQRVLCRFQLSHTGGKFYCTLLWWCIRQKKNMKNRKYSLPCVWYISYLWPTPIFLHDLSLCRFSVCHYMFCVRILHGCLWKHDSTHLVCNAGCFSCILLTTYQLCHVTYCLPIASSVCKFFKNVSEYLKEKKILINYFNFIITTCHLLFIIFFSIASYLCHLFTCQTDS